MSAGTSIATTTRLRLRELVEDDAGFMLELLNQPDFLRFIGDRGVRDLEQARSYLRDGPIASYSRHGLGMYLVEPRAGGAPIGLCGLVVRDGLPGPDIGFAFLPAYYGQGYAFEAASATLAHARTALSLPRVLAIVSPGNDRSIALLRRLGLRDAGTIQLPGKDEVILLFETTEPG
ncbi:GNAT family N-acetyltransferase [Pseudoxanthomonas daejeonensis]|uniref:GNAT family N-acetyltransferase n=1 Tax=Pseudoxanthomonas daejeonensis TaxID=266062 RepID=A0ABQ6Z707_9GAMM|nr:GNAT family N-acetyltransferase [Pseudoxanthomonas daejeonensis]KAF1694415.1 GNAT family N-acetyltransferase [Pseudoxanthomonas daejeonensis]